MKGAGACACLAAPLTAKRDFIVVIAPLVYERHGRDWCARYNRRIVEVELGGRNPRTQKRLDVSFYLLGRDS